MRKRLDSRHFRGIIMKKSMIHPTYGQIDYEENVWSGKKSISINGTPLQKISKKEYLLSAGGKAVSVTMRGSAMTGASLSIQNDEIQIVSKPSVLDWILSVFPFLMILVWGNSFQLCSIVPVVGGAIGGALGGFGMVLTVLAIREKNIAIKFLISILATLATFALGSAIAFMILA